MTSKIGNNNGKKYLIYSITGVIILAMAYWLALLQTKTELLQGKIRSNDTTSPTITLNEISAYYKNGPATFSGTANDDTEIKEVFYRTDSSRWLNADVSLGLSQYLWSANVDVTEGISQFSVKSSDISNNKSDTIVVDLKFDNEPPVINIFSPDNNSDSGDIVNVTGNVIDVKSGVAALFGRINNENWQEVMVDSNGIWFYQEGNLINGINVLSFKSEDNAGNESQVASISVNHQEDPDPSSIPDPDPEPSSIPNPSSLPDPDPSSIPDPEPSSIPDPDPANQLLTHIDSINWGSSSDPVAEVFLMQLDPGVMLWFEISKNGYTTQSSYAITTSPYRLQYGQILESNRTKYDGLSGNDYQLKIGVCDESSGFDIAKCNDMQSQTIYYSLRENTYVPAEIATLFPDVSVNHPHRIAIEYLANQNILNGYPDGYFRSTNIITRIELLKIIMNAKDMALSFDPAYSFPDVPESAWYAPYISSATKLGHVSGDNGLFYPNRTVSRVEALKISLNLYGIQTYTGDLPPYSDISINSWYASYVRYAKDQGLLKVNSDLFMPNKGLTRGEAAEMIYRIIN